MSPMPVLKHTSVAERSVRVSAAVTMGGRVASCLNMHVATEHDSLPATRNWPSPNTPPCKLCFARPSDPMGAWGT